MVANDLESKSSKKKKKKGARNKVANNGLQEAVPTTTEAFEGPSVTSEAPADTTDQSELDDSEVPPPGPSTATSVDDDTMTTLTNGMEDNTPADSTPDTSERFDTLVKDRDALRIEVTELRKSLEELQARHETDLYGLQEQLQDTQGEKEQAEEQYQNLLGKVNTIRSQLGERLKADAVRWTRISCCWIRS